MTEGWAPHRKNNPRKCDRCRSKATWIFKTKGRMAEYVCDQHKTEAK